MQLSLSTDSATKYKSGSQIARIITEEWVEENMFCPRCGNTRLNHFKNNLPVADFFCEKCNHEYKLKSKRGSIESKVADGAYSTMIERITSDKNPDFFFMNYSIQEMAIRDFFVMPKIFFTPSIIEKRRPLSSNARRAGWVGCNIVLSEVPKQGRIAIIQNSKIINKAVVIKKFQDAEKLFVGDIEKRGWLFDVLLCVNQIHNNEFSLNEIYAFEKILHDKHPSNNSILPKIRQQLQILRDKGLIEFLGNGRYKKIFDK